MVRVMGRGTVCGGLRDTETHWVVRRTGIWCVDGWEQGLGGWVGGWAGACDDGARVW